MSVELNMLDIFEIVIVVLSLKLITKRWKPPLQESLQAIISILFGSIIGCVLNPTKEGLVIGIIASSVAFYGKDLLSEFTELKEDLKDANIEIKDK